MMSKWQWFLSDKELNNPVSPSFENSALSIFSSRSSRLFFDLYVIITFVTFLALDLGPLEEISQALTGHRRSELLHHLF